MLINEKLSRYIYVFLWTVCIALLSLIGATRYQIFKDIFFFSGSSVLLLIVILLRKVNLKNPVLLTLIIGYCCYIAYYVYTTHTGYGREYLEFLLTKFAMIGAAGICVIDMFATHRYSLPSTKNKWYLWLCIVSFVGVMAVRSKISYAIACPILVFYLTEMTEKEWTEQIKYLAYGMYISYTILILVSFIFYPNTYDTGRYVGFFQFPATIGLISGMGIISSVFLSFYVYKKVMSKKKMILMFVIMLILPLGGLIRSFDRTAILALLLMFINFFAIKFKNNKPTLKGLLLRMVACIAVVALGLAISIFILDLLGRYHDEISELHVASENNIVLNLLLYLSAAGLYISNPYDFYGGNLFGGNNILNVIDNLLSGRLSLWYIGLTQSTLLGKDDTSLTLPTEYAEMTKYPHVHNTYIQWLLSYGYIFGSLLVVCVLVSLFLTGKEFCKKNNVYDLSFLTMLFVVPFAFFEREMWQTLTMMLLLIVQYPLLVEFKKKDDRLQ